MKKYVFYTNDKAAIDSALGGLPLDTSFMNEFKIAEKNNHRVVVFTAFDECKEQFKQFLEMGEFLACVDGDACCAANPCNDFSEDENLKIDLAEARGLFNG